MNVDRMKHMLREAIDFAQTHGYVKKVFVSVSADDGFAYVQVIENDDTDLTFTEHFRSGDGDE
ncbi:MAG: hypothetical protein IKG18_08840 [Atopobiaceae bacterium]|nr:hypothetical protein [Atopobiaceae bacterium]MBR4614296.1 hypothetical protein [Kiritimatiellia bacterium]